MHVYVCLLASMLYLHLSLSRSRLCPALCPPWACAYVVASIPPRACFVVTICEIHLRGVGMLDIHLSLPCNVDILAMLALRHPFGFLCFLTSLHACLHVHAWVCVSSIQQSNGTMDTQSKPSLILLGHLLLFDNMLVCPLHMLHMFICPSLASFASFSFGILSFYLFLFLSTSLFPRLLHVLVEWGCLEWGHDLLGTSKKGKKASKRLQAHKGQCSIELRA